MKRILLKISGEAFSWEWKAIDPIRAQGVAEMITKIQSKGVEIVIVIGGGNIYRGSSLIEAGVNPADSHNMSMLSTVFNSVTLKNFLYKQGIDSVVLDALHVEFLEKYTSINAQEYINQWKIVICSSGTGVPFFTTDTGWVLRALELKCEAVIKLTKVDGVYDSDPVTNPQAKKFDILSYNEVIQKDLKILDQTAIIMARDNALPIYVSSLNNIEALLGIIEGKAEGTKIS